MFGECHAHVLMNGYNYKKAVLTHQVRVHEPSIRSIFSAYQKAQVTFIRDGGDAHGVSKRAKMLAPEYHIEYRTPIYAIHKNGHYGGIVGKGFDTLAEYHTLVCRAIMEGADFIKIMVSGIINFNSPQTLTSSPLDSEEIKEMIHIAHQEGRAVMVHANGADAVLAAVLAGADSIEHGNYINQDCLQAMADRHTVWVPTLAPIFNLLQSDRFPSEIVKGAGKAAAQKVLSGFQMGVQLALGSDAGAYLVSHGQGICQEYQYFQDLLGTGTELDLHLSRGEAEIRQRFRVL